MKKSIKIFLVLLSICFVTLSANIVVFAKVDIPQATDKFYVNDFADVFTESEEDELMQKAVDLAEKTEGVQVVVTTIKSLDGEELEEYANEMYNQYGIGKDDMGLLLLLSTEDRLIRVEVGRKMEQYIPDSKAGRFVDNYAIPSLKENKFNEGLIKLQGAFIEEISTKVTNVEEASNSMDTVIDISSFIMPIVWVIFAASIIVLIYFLIRTILEKIKARITEVEKLNQEVDNLNSQIKEERIRFTSMIEELQSKNDSLKTNLNTLEKSYNILEDHYQKAKKIYPDVERKVSKMIEEEIIKANMERAKKVDLTIMRVINLEASKDIVDEIEKALSMYQDLTKQQRKYVKSNVEKLKDLYQKSSKLKIEYEKKQKEKAYRNSATKAQEKITNLIGDISRGRASNYRKVKDAMDLYESLDCCAQKYFDATTLLLLQELLGEAKRDKKRLEEEEERRRNSYYYDDFEDEDSGGFGGFGGFGGSSGGGGASRGF